MTSEPPARYAGIVSRTAALAIDVVAFAILSTGTVFFLQALVAMVDSVPMGDASVDSGIAGAAAGFVTFIYFVGGWSIFGRTGGEALLGLRVVRNDGSRVHAVRAAIRFFVSVPSLAILGIGYLWIIVDKRRRGWADLVARTVVIYDWGHRPEE